jgi:hypothetical protein
MNADNKRLLLIILISPDSGILILARWAADSASFPATVLLVIDYREGVGEVRNRTPEE